MGKYTFITKDNQPVLMLNNDLVSWPDAYFQPHCHRMLEISMQKSGSGVYHIDGKEYDCQPGDVFFISNREEHQLVPLPDHPVRNMTLHFDPEFVCMPFETNTDASFLTIFFNHSSKHQNRLDRNNPATKRIYDMLLQIEQETDEKKPYYHLKVRLILETVLLEIMRNYDYWDTSSEPPKYNKSELYRITEVLDYIKYNLHTQLTLEELARVACVSPSYFSSIFKQYNGTTLFEYIAQKRIEYAVTLIRTTKYSITEISHLCGFNNSTSFNKTFKRIMGCSPSFIRKTM